MSVIPIPPGHRVVRATLVLQDPNAPDGHRVVASWEFDVAVPVVMGEAEIAGELERRLSLPKIEVK